LIYRVVFHLRIAYENLKIHKARMLLALLGILFAVMSLFSFANISEGMKKKIDREIGRFGRNLIILRAGLVFHTPRGLAPFQESNTLKLSDLRRMKENIPGIVRIVPFFDAGFRVRYEGKVVRATIVGAERDIFFIKDIDTFRGRLFDNGEEMERNAVIGYKVYTNLFSSDPIGKYILIYRIPTKVIGVLEEKGVDYTGQDLDLQIFIPLEAFMRKYRNVDYVRGAYIQIEDGRDLKEMKETIAHFLRKIHGLKESEKDDFTIFTMDDILRTKEQGIKLVSTLTIISSLVSFAVGGLGIFAIMLLTVAERKVEIGIRRAVGSKKKDIILQFLTESAIIAATGGIAGLVAGLIITLIVDHIGKFPFAIKTSTLLFSFAITTLVGILAGVYPALQGRKYEPIEVLYQ